MNEQTLKDIDHLTDIAKKYANLLMEHGGTLYSGIQINTHSKTFYFSVGPSTHGMSRSVTLPINITQEELYTLAEQQKQKWKEEQEKLTCKCCGNIKYSLSNYIY